MKRLFCLIALVGLLAGCGEPRKDQLQQLGLLGQHDLRRIEQTSGINGHMDGSFFLGIGSVSGNLVSERKLQFYWGRTAEEFISTTLSYSMFRFVVDESKTVPTVEFVFDENWLNSKRTVYTESEKSNLNWWLADDQVRNDILRVAVVRISRKDLEKEVYLPRQ
ncbi:MAG: hypothetical protein ABIG65_02480 [Patescibacteria group bacterium]